MNSKIGHLLFKNLQPIVLINGRKLADLMHEYSIGVQVKNTYEVKEIDEDFFEGI